MNYALFFLNFLKSKENNKYHLHNKHNDTGTRHNDTGTGKHTSNPKTTLVVTGNNHVKEGKE